MGRQERDHNRPNQRQTNQGRQGQRSGRQGQGEGQQRFNLTFDPKILTEGGEILVDMADKLGQQLSRNNLTTSQIRGIYGAVKKMQTREFDSHRFIMLKPKLAYAAKRDEAVAPLEQMLRPAITEVGDDQQKFARFVDFFEAILAYHKFHGGRD